MDDMDRTDPNAAAEGGKGKIAEVRSQRVRSMLRGRLGEEVFTSWFN